MAINNAAALEYILSYYDGYLSAEDRHGYYCHNGDPGPNGDQNICFYPYNYGNNKTFTGVGTGTRTFTADLTVSAPVGNITHITLFYYPYTNNTTKKAIFSVELEALVNLASEDTLQFEYTLSLEDGLF